MEKNKMNGTLQRQALISKILVFVLVLSSFFVPRGTITVYAEEGAQTPAEEGETSSAITVKEGTGQSFVTQIVNGNFEETPWESYVLGGKTYTGQPSSNPLGANFAAIPNDVGKGWNTTENSPYQGSLFEVWDVKNLPAEKNRTFPKANGNYFIEMNANNPACLYQDLATQGGDVIKWTLQHAARTDCGCQEQRMYVTIGAPVIENGKIVPATGVKENIDTKIQDSGKAVYEYNGVTTGAGIAYANEVDLEGLSLKKPDTKWYDVSGIYVVPQGQDTTRFAFCADASSKQSGDMDKDLSGGNFLDNITFSTLLGSLKATKQSDGRVEITGYWGDTNTEKRLVIDLGQKTYYVNMSQVCNKNFEITVPKDMVDGATSVNIYHEDYASAAKKVSITYEHTWNYKSGNIADSDANIIYAYCSKTEMESGDNLHDCTYKESAKNVYLTLTAPDAVYNGNAYNEAQVSDWSIEDVALAEKPEITYYCLDGGTETKTNASNSGAASEGAAPKNAGKYRAEITISDGTGSGSDTEVKATAEAAFTITPGGSGSESDSDSGSGSSSRVDSGSGNGSSSRVDSGSGNGSSSRVDSGSGNGSSPRVDNSSGSEGTASSPAPAENFQIPVKNENTVKVEAVIRENTANVSEITNDTIDQVINSKDEQSKVDTITIDLSGAKQEVTGVTLSKESVKILADTTAQKDNGIDTATIELSGAAVKLDHKTLETLSEQAKGTQIQLVVADKERETLNYAQQSTLDQCQVATTFEAYFTSDGQRIHDFKGGTAVVSVDFTPEAGKDVSYYHMVYVAENGEMTRYKTKYEAGRLMFTTTHFSDYAVIYDVTDKNETVEQAQEKDNKDESTDTDGKVELDSSFCRLRLRIPVSTKTTNVLKWTKQSGADGYVIYAGKCNTGDRIYRMVKKAEISNGSVTTWTDKKLTGGTYYKYYIKAYRLADGKKIWLAKSRVVHSTTTGGKYGNAKAVKVNKSAVSLTAGSKFAVKAIEVKNDRAIKKHTAIGYESGNSRVATVNSKGVITAKGKGTCYIYAYAQNGVYKKIKVTVK